VLVLTRSDTLGLVSLENCIAAVEDAFGAAGRGETLSAHRLFVPSSDGAFHITAGGTSSLLGVKVNGRFPPAAVGAGERVNGSLLLADATSGVPVALLDSMVVTGLRTAALTAVVVKHLARGDADVATVVGAGRQAHGQVQALRASMKVARLFVYDRLPKAAEDLAAKCRDDGIDATAVANVEDALAETDVCVTITPATEAIVREQAVREGALVVALGADGPGKQELDPMLLAGSSVFVDVLEQAAAAGELQHALADGLIELADVRGDLGSVVAGYVGRRSDTERIVFDGTGTALQDVVAGSLIVGAARAAGRGLEIELAT
jgi:ornithine cyclodeaminase/alanine dehydrogenase-like protein (mu-crystallin family)